VFASTDPDAPVVVMVYDRAAGGFKVYESLTEAEQYDIVNVPVEDKDGTGSVHVVLTNTSTTVATTVNLTIKVTSLA
jgi:hypothetical protein